MCSTFYFDNVFQMKIFWHVYYSPIMKINTYEPGKGLVLITEKTIIKM